MGRKEEFIKIFNKAEKKYSENSKRLAGEGWGEAWKTLIVTIMSAQSRDETTIPIAETLFGGFDSLEKLSKARVNEIEKALKGMNYYRTKARNVKGSAKMLLSEFGGKMPEKVDELVKLPGVGRKTANLVLTEEFGGDGICVDTHVHRIANVMGWVNTKNPTQTEFALMEIVPKKYWSRINRILVLWGKEVPGRDKERLMASLDE